MAKIIKHLQTKALLKAAGIRALRTLVQTLGGTIPAGFAVTPVMIQNANWNYLHVFLAWLATGIVTAFASFCTALVTGLPEVTE